MRSSISPGDERRAARFLGVRSGWWIGEAE
jgi:hypothetical protein